MPDWFSRVLVEGEEEEEEEEEGMEEDRELRRMRRDTTERGIELDVMDLLGARLQQFLPLQRVFFLLLLLPVFSLFHSDLFGRFSLSPSFSISSLNRPQRSARNGRSRLANSHQPVSPAKTINIIARETGRGHQGNI